jgi:hypothetical protein
MNLPRRVKDISGKTFGRWTVLSYAETDEAGSALWLCRCDCGEEKLVLGTRLRLGQSKSCGCGQLAWYRRLPEGEAARHMLFVTLKRKAIKYRKLSWSIDEPEFQRLVQMDCHYCGQTPSQQFYYQPGGKYDKTKKPYLWNGLDRVDSNKHYSLDNVVPCCSVCNRAKMAMSQEEFLIWVERVYRFQHKVEASHA